MVRSSDDRFKDSFDREFDYAILHGFDLDVDLMLETSHHV